MGSIGNMFSRRAAAAEGSHARDEAKLALRRLGDKREKALSSQVEKVEELQKQLSSTKNGAFKSAIEKKIEHEQTVLANMRAETAKVSACKKARRHNQSH